MKNTELGPGTQANIVGGIGRTADGKFAKGHKITVKWKSCNTCKKEFYGQNKKFCSRACAGVYFSKLYKGKKRLDIIPVIVSCKWCKNTFRIVPSGVKESGNFCSRKCFYFYKKGKDMGKRKGIKASEITKRKLSKSYKIKGVDHWNWRGGITSKNEKIRHSIEMRFWREANFARDNYTCQKCKEKGERLIAHHIQNFAQCPELRTSIENGVTLCKNCHLEFHRKYGIKNNTKEQIKEFLHRNGRIYF